MAFLGVWGMWYHIPKCGGMSVMDYLGRTYADTGGTLIGGTHETVHWLPERVRKLVDLEGVQEWTIVRNPVSWLQSYYSYMNNNYHEWAPLPEEISCLMPDTRMSWGDWLEALKPDTVNQVFGLYVVDGVKWYRLEQMFWLPKIHETRNKVGLTIENIDLICEKERKCFERFGYLVEGKDRND